MADAMSAEPTIRRLGRTLARFVGLIFALLGAWILVVNLASMSYSGWILTWVLTSGIVGAAGGALYLLSFDGPERLRTRPVRLTGWLGMLVLAFLPTSLSIPLLAMILLTLPTLGRRSGERGV